MEKVYPKSNNSFVYSCFSNSQWGYEQFIPHHTLAYQVSGETHFFHQKGTIVLKKNQILLAHRNQFAKSLKVLGNDNEYKAVSILLKSDDLKKYVALNGIENERNYKGNYNIILKNDDFLTSYFKSLIPYIERPELSNEKMNFLKIVEAIEILKNIYPEVNSFLFDFTEPFKIDIEKFMNENFKYNVPIENFAKLTGRSLAGFKRDFIKTFNDPPAKWLKNKRLEEAYYLIHKKNKKPSDFYLELGFENLSHFYTSFKKKYGITPSESLTSNR